MMLNSLVIKNFRMLEDFTVEKLGRVNLIVGKNNSGKSTVLEALRIYAGNANQELLEEIAKSHDEKCFLDEDNSLPYEDLFTGRKFSEEEIAISIGEINNEQEHLKIYHVYVTEKEYIQEDMDGNKDKIKRNISVTQLSLVQDNNILDEGLSIHKKKQAVGLRFNMISPNFRRFSTITPMLKCCFVPTQFVSMEELKKNWDNNIYMIKEETISEALKIISPNFQQLGFYGETPNLFVKVKLDNEPNPVPLKSLGDGMLRILQIAIKLVSAQGGFLLIDEFENGLHYSVQENVWRLLFEMAEKLDIQIFATTHSWDCVQSFNNVAIEKENIEAMLIHMGKSARKSNYGQIIASIYDKNELHSMTQSDIEVR